jgi:hypothetical protein
MPSLTQPFCSPVPRNSWINDSQFLPHLLTSHRLPSLSYHAYKRRRPPLPLTAPPPLIFPLPLSSSATLTEFHCCRCFITIARPPDHRPSSGVARDGFPVPHSLFCAPAGELPCPGAAEGLAPVSAPSCLGDSMLAPPLIHGGPCALPWSIVHGPGPRIFLLEIIHYFDLIWLLCRGVPVLLGNKPTILNFVVRPLVFEK